MRTLLTVIHRIRQGNMRVFELKCEHFLSQLAHFLFYRALGTGGAAIF